MLTTQTIRILFAAIGLVVFVRMVAQWWLGR